MRVQVAGFLVYCRPGVDRIEARVLILDRWRVLQTGILHGAIGPSGDAETAEGELRFTLDAAPPRRLATLSRRSTFGAAIVTNYAANGTPQRVAIVGDRVASITLGDTTLQAITDRFHTAISDIAAAPENFTQLRIKDSVALLRDLAQQGAGTICTCPARMGSRGVRTSLSP
jgi:hypothetical protein